MQDRECKHRFLTAAPAGLEIQSHVGFIIYFLFLLFSYFFLLGFVFGRCELYSSTSPPKVRKTVASQWPIPTLRVGANGSEVVFNYPSLPAVILLLILAWV